jgi:CRP-like cAMP-binding protein
MQDAIPSPFVRNFQRLGPITPAEQYRLDSLTAEEHRIAARRKLIDDGRRSHQVFIVKQGWVAEFKQLPDGGRQILSFRLPGEVIGIECLAYEMALHATATLTDCVVACVSRAAFEVLQRDHPRLMSALFLLTLRDRAILNGWLINLGRRAAFIRVTHLLLELTQRLQIRGIAGGPHIPLPLTQQDIADSTGLTTSYVNRIIQDLRQRGLVRLRDHILEILRPEELARLAGFKPDYLQFFPQMANPPAADASLGEAIAPQDLRSPV